MFNSLLNRKEKMGYILFYWVIIVSSIGLGIQFYKWVSPEAFVIKETQYVVVEQVGLKELTQGQNVKYGGRNLCVSSIRENRMVDDYNANVEINLRTEGSCK